MCKLEQDRPVVLVVRAPDWCCWGLVGWSLILPVSLQHGKVRTPYRASMVSFITGG